MSLGASFGIVMAIGVAVAGATIAAAVVGRVGRRVPQVAAGAVGAAGLGAWVAFGLRPELDLALAAGGLVGCALAAAAAVPLQRVLEQGRRIEEEAHRAEATLNELIEREAAARAAELERTLARARADSVSLLVEEERRIADERRRELGEREQAVSAELSAGFAATQRGVEQRLGEFAEDLARAQQNLQAQLERISERQRELFELAESRLAADAERIESSAEGSRRVVATVRSEVEQRVTAVLEAASSELELHAAERRKALHEVADRLRRRERELTELIEREEGEAVARIKEQFTQAERRQLEQLARVVEREIVRHSEAAGLQFAEVVKAAREGAARRLARELDRAVETFAREAESALAARLAEVSDRGAQRIEGRLGEITESLEHARDEFTASLAQRLSETESDLRHRLENMVADGESERAILEARLHEVSRRVEELASKAEERLTAIESLRAD